MIKWEDVEMVMPYLKVLSLHLFLWTEKPTTGNLKKYQRVQHLINIKIAKAYRTLS
jgi:hypothetical protein